MEFSGDESVYGVGESAKAVDDEKRHGHRFDETEGDGRDDADGGDHVRDLFHNAVHRTNFTRLFVAVATTIIKIPLYEETGYGI